MLRLSNMKPHEIRAHNYVVEETRNRNIEFVEWYLPDTPDHFHRYPGTISGADPDKELTLVSKAGSQVVFHHSHRSDKGFSDADWTAFCGTHTSKFRGMSPFSEIWAHGNKSAIYRLRPLRNHEDIYAAFSKLRKGLANWCGGHRIVSSDLVAHFIGLNMGAADFVEYDGRVDVQPYATVAPSYCDILDAGRRRKFTIQEVLHDAPAEIAKMIR